MAFGSFESIEQSTLPEFAIRESPASSADLFCGIYREVHTSRHFTRSSAERLASAAVFAFPPLHAPDEFKLSRDSQSGVHRESERYSRNSFRASVLNPMKSPNHALQRTAPRVTVAAISSLDPSRPSGALSYARDRLLRSTTQLPRRAPQSLSLGSLGVSSRYPNE